MTPKLLDLTAIVLLVGLTLTVLSFVVFYGYRHHQNILIICTSAFFGDKNYKQVKVMIKSKKIALTQPECHVIRFHSNDVICTSSPGASNRNGQNEEYKVERTNIWF